jgi:hypothetical protein
VVQRREKQKQGKPDENEYDRIVEKINFIVVNFEPWKIEEMLKNMIQKEGYMKFLEDKNLTIDRPNVCQLLKIKDLQAFGNSIIELMVGKCEEHLSVTNKDN